MPRSPLSRLDLLERAPKFQLLFLATLSSGLGTWLSVVALQVDVQDRTHSPTWVGGLLIADFLPAVAIGLLAGPIVDRFSRRRLMIASDLARAVVFCALPFAGSATAIVALAGVAGFATGFFRPAVYAGMPNLVEERDLAQANGLLQSVENLTWMFGALLGGALVAVQGPHLAYWINAATFISSAALVAGIPRRLLQTARAASRGHLTDLVEGFALVRRSRALLTVFVVWNIAMLALACQNVAEIFLAKRSFHAGSFGFGLLMASAGLGLVIGSLATSTATQRYGIARVYSGSLALMALGIGAAAASPDVWVAAVCVVVSGAGNGAAVVCNALLVQRGAPDHLRGRAFTVLMGSTAATLALGMAGAGPLTACMGARLTWALAAGISALASVVGLLLARGIPTAASGEVGPLPHGLEPSPAQSTEGAL